MSAVHLDLQMNFTSALLLHSCLTLLTKEFCNGMVILHRASLSSKGSYGRSNALHSVQSSAIVDAYTSIFSNDADGELAELYYTNTGAVLLFTTLSASVAMNLYLADLVLNVLVAGTFGLCFHSLNGCWEETLHTASDGTATGWPVYMGRYSICQFFYVDLHRHGTQWCFYTETQRLRRIQMHRCSRTFVHEGKACCFQSCSSRDHDEAIDRE